MRSENLCIPCKINIRKADKKQIVKVLKYYDKLIMTEMINLMKKVSL